MKMCISDDGHLGTKSRVYQQPPKEKLDKREKHHPARPGMSAKEETNRLKIYEFITNTKKDYCAFGFSRNNESQK